jgi:hypothetical protein
MSWFWFSKKKPPEYDYWSDAELGVPDPQYTLAEMAAIDGKVQPWMLYLLEHNTPCFDDRYPQSDERHYLGGPPRAPIMAYLKAHPHTSLNSTSLLIHLTTGEAQAERELEERERVCGSYGMSAEERAEVLARRAAEIMWMLGQADDASDIQFRMMLAEGDNKRAVARQLENIRTAIDRSAVGANALDLAKQHPVITAVLAELAINALKR